MAPNSIERSLGMRGSTRIALQKSKSYAENPVPDDDERPLPEDASKTSGRKRKANSESAPKPTKRPKSDPHPQTPVKKAIPTGGIRLTVEDDIKVASPAAPTRRRSIAPIREIPKSTKSDAVPKKQAAKKAKPVQSVQPLNQPATVVAAQKSKIGKKGPSKSRVVTLKFPKLQLSKRLTKRRAIQDKPNVQGIPEVWADSRQAMCETLPFFRKPQGGCYSNDSHVYGFLFDGVGHCREYVDSDVIICRAGGGMEPDGAGNMVQRKDQLMSEAQVQAVLNDKAHQNPVVVIMGNKNINAICKMPKRYCVLGWFLPTAVWAEKTSGKSSKVWTTIKYRLERLNCLNEPAWFAPHDSNKDYQISPQDRQISGEKIEIACESCQEESPQVYLQTWICLNPKCPQFWKVDGEDAPYGKDGLDYHPAFILSRSSLSNQPEPAPLRPPVPDVGNVIGDNLTYINTRGICCPKCGRCSSRRLFKGWQCEGIGCDFSFFPAQRTIQPASLLSFTPWDSARTLSRNKFSTSVDLEVRHVPGYKLSVYTFEGVDGCFIHASAKENAVKEPRGADEMFAALQEHDLGLERRVFAVQRMSGGRILQESTDSQEWMSAVEPEKQLEQSSNDPSLTEIESTPLETSKQEYESGDLMTAFARNWGMPYKFIGRLGSSSFDEAAWPVTEARRKLNWAAGSFLNDPDQADFNEELIFAYLEGQKIEYHDDGEAGLGKCIATMSLGGKATMKLRLKQKHFVGCSKVGIFTEEKPVPGGFGGKEMYQKRLHQWTELQTLKHNNPAAYNKRRKQIPKELGIFEKKSTTPKDAVEVTLSHGDIIIMDGYDIQKYMEHQVVASAQLRFALTCRTILASHLKEDEKPDYTVEEDLEKYEGPM